MSRAQFLGNEIEFYFRYSHPKPGDEKEHARFVEFLRCNGWPSQADYKNGRHVMFYPPAWRDAKYKGCKTMHDFQTAKQGNYQKFFDALKRNIFWQGETERVHYTYDANQCGTSWGSWTT